MIHPTWIKASRKLHLWISLGIALPSLLIFITGVLLQLKHFVPAIQPTYLPGTPGALQLSFDQILAISRTVPEAEVESWKDIRVIDVRPNQGAARVRMANHYEVQIDTQTGEILNHGYRATGVLIALHEGQWFGKSVRYGFFLPVGILLILLWISGILVGLAHWKAKLTPRPYSQGAFNGLKE